MFLDTTKELDVGRGSGCIYLFESVAELRTKRAFVVVIWMGWGFGEVTEMVKIIESGGMVTELGN